jgi:hypothetical protein
MPGPEGTCPGATTGKGGCLETRRDGGRPTCYVYKAFRNLRVKEILEHNTEVMKNATGPQMETILHAEFTRFEAEEAVSPKPWFHYRLHWSGDVFSREYAFALSIAIQKHPKTTFWIYTRSFQFVHVLTGIPNLIPYLSLDPINMERGLETWKQDDTHTLKLAYMSPEDNLAQVAGVNSVPCPSDNGRLREIEGACHKCGKCVLGNSDIWFKVK